MNAPWLHMYTRLGVRMAASVRTAHKGIAPMTKVTLWSFKYLRKQSLGAKRRRSWELMELQSENTQLKGTLVGLRMFKIWAPRKPRDLSTYRTHHCYIDCGCELWSQGESLLLLCKSGELNTAWDHIGQFIVRQPSTDIAISQRPKQLRLNIEGTKQNWLPPDTLWNPKINSKVTCSIAISGKYVFCLIQSN